MYSIDLMIEEHNQILRFNKVFRAVCTRILNNEMIEPDDIRSMIDFIRTYADKHHHGKEEMIFFKEMQNHLGAIGDKLITHGMFVEHDLGRLFISDLEQAVNEYEKSQSDDSRLDIIASAIGYTKLLQRHIDKENNVVYSYGEKNLSKDILNEIDAKIKEFEVQASDQKLQEHYLHLLKQMEEKYL